MDEPFLKLNLKSALFVLCLLIFGLCLGLIFIEDLEGKELLSMIFVMISMVFASIGLYFTIKNNDE